MPRLVKVTPAGGIVGALFDSPKTYGELRSATGISDRWLSLKLKELASTRIIEHQGDYYRLNDPSWIVEADPVFARLLQTRIPQRAKARTIANEIGRNRHVVAIILFGSVAKRKGEKESDIDLLIITDKEMEAHLNNLVYKLMFEYDTPVDAIFQTYDDLIASLQAKTTFSFGLLECYEVLYDKGGVEGLLSIKKRAIRRSWIYDKEVEAWIQKKLMSTLQPLKTN